MTIHGQHILFFHLQVPRTIYNVYNLVQRQMHTTYNYTFTGNPSLSQPQTELKRFVQEYVTGRVGRKK